MGFLSKIHSILSTFYESVRTKLSPKEKEEIKEVIKTIEKEQIRVEHPVTRPPPPMVIDTRPPEPTPPPQEVWILDIVYNARWGQDRSDYYKLPQHYKVTYSVDSEDEHTEVRQQALEHIRTINRGTWNERITVSKG